MKMKSYAWIALVLLPFVTQARASQAVFSKDATHVYLANQDFIHPQPVLVDVDLNAPEQKKIVLTNFMGPQNIEAVSRLPDGRLALLTEGQLWLYDAGKNTCVKFFTAPKHTHFYDVACNPADGAFLICTTMENTESKVDEEEISGSLWLSADGKKSARVFMRRVDYGMQGIVFDSKGGLHFSVHGDLWDGTLAMDWKNEYHPVVLVAERVAPLATLETYEGTPEQMGADDTAIAGDWIYTHVRRMGGSGWGTMVRLKVTKPEKAEGELPLQWKIYGDALRSVEFLEDNPSGSYLCASEDGTKVFFTTHNDPASARLVENNGKPEPLFGSEKKSAPRE